MKPRQSAFSLLCYYFFFFVGRLVVPSAAGEVELDFTLLDPRIDQVRVGGILRSDKDFFSEYFRRDSEWFENIPSGVLKTNLTVPPTDCASVSIVVEQEDGKEGFDFSIDDVAILYDGRRVVESLKGPFNLWTGHAQYIVASVGENCVAPSCDNEEDLLVEFDLAGLIYSDLSLIDSETNEVLFSMLNLTYSVFETNYAQAHMCLPKGSCYTILTQNIAGYYDPLAFNATVDGREIEDFGTTPAGRHDIGDCQATFPVCKDDESELEVFIRRGTSNTYQQPEMTMSLQDDKGSLDRSDTIIGNDLYWRRECIKSSSCARFRISIPETYDLPVFPPESGIDLNDAYNERGGTYLLVLDGVYYGGGRPVKYEFGKALLGPDDIDQRVFEDMAMFGQCSTDSCGPGESLLDVSITSATLPAVPNTSATDVPWMSVLQYEEPAPATSDSNSFDLLSVPVNYKHYACLNLTDVTCAVFVTTKTDGIASTLEISLDGTIVNDRESEGKKWLDGLVTWYLGGNGCDWGETPAPSQAPTQQSVSSGAATTWKYSSGGIVVAVTLIFVPTFLLSHFLDI